MNKKSLSHYQAPLCRTVWLRAAKPLAISDPNILYFGLDDAPGGRIDDGDIYDYFL